jgi:hypothetical protein
MVQKYLNLKRLNNSWLSRNSRYIRLEGMSKITKISLRIVGILVDIRTGEIPHEVRSVTAWCNYVRGGAFMLTVLALLARLTL